MKKRLSWFAAAGVTAGILIGLTGCGGAEAGQNAEAFADFAPETETITPENAAESPENAFSRGANTADADGAGNYIGEDAAKSAALEHAGLAENQIAGPRVKLERDDGRAEYEVEFYHGNAEYDYEIDALTGEILSAKIDSDD